MKSKKLAAIVLAAVIAASSASVALAAPLTRISPVAYSYTDADGATVVETAEELKEALSGTESVIRLGADDIIASITIESGRTVELDLAGHTLRNEDGLHTITVKGKLTVTDSVGGGVVDNVTHACAAVVNQGVTILEGGKFTRSAEAENNTPESSGGNSYYVLVNQGTQMDIYKDVTVILEGSFSSMIRNGGGTGTSKMTIYGGYFKGGLNTVKNDDCGVLTIQGGKFENVAQSAVLNWNKAVIEGGEFISAGENDAPVILNGSYGSTETVGNLVIKGGTFSSDDPDVPAIGMMRASKGKETAQITGGVFYNPVAEKGYDKVKIDAQAAQVEVNEADATAYRIGRDAISFEVQEGDIVRVKELPGGQSMELYGDADTVTVINETGKTIVVNGVQVGFEAGTDTGVQVPVYPDAPEREERDTTGGDYFGNAKWAEVKRAIAAADEGDTIEVSATGLPWFPSSVARALKGKDVTLEVRKNGVTYSINGLEIGAIEKIWYEFDQIETELLTAEAPESK